MLDGPSLEAFIAIADHRHFVRAADSLGVVQSVVSKRMARLEQAVGAQLVDRSVRNNIRLTRSGELFLDEARRTLATLRQAERIGRNLARGERGPLRIGYVFSAAMTGTLTKMVVALRRDLPCIEVHLSLMDTPAQLRALAAGTLDIGLIRPRPSYPVGLRAATIHRECVALALATAHPLALRGPIRAGDLAGETFIVPQFHEDVGLIDAIRDLARTGAIPMPKVRRVDDFISVATLVAAGSGVALVPNSLGRLALDGLAIRPLAGHDASLSLICVTRHDAPPAAARIVASLIDPATRPCATLTPDKGT